MNNQNQVQYSNIRSTDLLKHEGLNLFYDSKDAVNAYLTRKGILAKREISSKVLELLNNFLSYDYSQEEIDFINELFKNNSTKINSEIKAENKSNVELFDFLKSLDVKGVFLLGIGNDIDIKILKKLYRKASLKHHPDIGGNNEVMKDINSAYSLFYEAISDFRPANEESITYYINTPPGCWDEWMYSVHLILSCVYSDLFATDKSYTHLIISNNYFKKSESRYLGQFIENFPPYYTLDSIAHALARFDMNDELKIAAGILSNFYDRYIQDWSPSAKYDTKPDRINYPNKAHYLSKRKVKIVFYHVEQVKNAYRLGKIDSKRYLKEMSKFDSNIKTEDIKLDKINNFIETVGFINELSSKVYSTKSNKPKAIGMPRTNQDRFELLNEDQKWEYLYVFTNKNTAHTFSKYYWVRVHEILFGLISNYEYIDLKKLHKEIIFFKNNFKEYPAYHSLDEIYNHLSLINIKTRQNILKVLIDLDEPDYEKYHYASPIESTPYGHKYSAEINGLVKKRIELNEDYIEFAKMDTNFLSDFIKNGKKRTPYLFSQEKDIESLELFIKNQIYKNYYKIWLCNEIPTPEMVINSTKPYVEKLLEIGNTFHIKNTGELQLGYNINRLTIALFKLKRFKEVVYWGDLFLNLPHNYKDRSTLKEQEIIRKRVERAKKNYKTNK